MANFDSSIVSDAIAQNKDELFGNIRRSTRQEILDLSPNQCLTFLLVNNGIEAHSLEPEVSENYAGALIAFCRGKKYRGNDVESYVTGTVIKAVEKTILDFYGSDVVCAAVSDAITEHLARNNAGSQSVKGGILETSNWLSNEMKVITHEPVAYSIAGTVVDVASQQVGDFFQTTVGKQVVLVIGKMLATTSGKIAVMNAVRAVVAKVMASAALQTVLVNFIRKVGVGVLIKTAIGKAIIALLAVVGIAHVPLVWIILPIIAGFLVYEYNKFPDKLAEKIPNEVVSIIEGQFNLMNDTMSKSIFSAIIEKLESEVTKVRFS